MNFIPPFFCNWSRIQAEYLPHSNLVQTCKEGQKNEGENEQMLTIGVRHTKMSHFESIIL